MTARSEAVFVERKKRPHLSSIDLQTSNKSFAVETTTSKRRYSSYRKDLQYDASSILDELKILNNEERELWSKEPTRRHVGVLKEI